MLRGLFLNLIVFVYESLSNGTWLFSGYSKYFFIVFYVLYYWSEIF